MLSSCPFCHVVLPSSQLEWHANTHFAGDELERDTELAMQISLLPQNLEAMDKPTDCLKTVAHSGRYPCNSAFNNYGLNSKDGLEQEIALLVSLQSKSTLYNVEGDLMSLLRKCLESESGNSVSVISGYVDHYQSVESEDIGWGCGWRNIQMLSSHLLAERSDARDAMFGRSGFVPDITSLQRWLEIAWKRGFDVYGSNFFNERIYGSRKWIGATECAAILRSFGLKARIVDFDSVNSRKQQNTGNSKCKMDVNQLYGPMDKFLKNPKHEVGPSSSSKYSDRKIHGPEVLLDWVWKYFNCEFGSRLGSSNSVLISKKTPLYFQHDGHSRTIVGIQMQKAKSSSACSYSLLILDPAHRTAALEGSLNSNKGWQRMIKRGAHTLKKPQYQLCYVDPGIATIGEEMEQLKYIDSILVEL